jgi:hypothetical protein
LLSYFLVFISSRGGQIANPQIFGLTKFVIFADLPQVWQFADLPFADPIFFAICGFKICEPNFFGGPKTSAYPQILYFYPYKYTYIFKMM